MTALLLLGAQRLFGSEEYFLLVLLTMLGLLYNDHQLQEVELYLTGKGVNIFKNIYPCSVLQGRAKEELHFTIPSTHTTTCMVNFQPLNSGRTMQFSVLCSSLYYDPLSSVALKGAPKMFIMGGCLKVNAGCIEIPNFTQLFRTHFFL